MYAKRQQAAQILFALSYGDSRDARLRLEAAVPPNFVTRIKRLLEIDLKWARTHGELMLGFSMAFYDELPLGTGHEVRYSPFRVFNLAVALELVRFGGKQGEVVDLIAQIQGDLSSAFNEANSSRQTSGRTNVLAIEPSGADSSSSEKRRELQIYLALRCVEVTPRGAEYLGESHSVGERLFDRKLLRGPEALSAYIATEVCDGLFGVFVLELSELAVRITELIQDVPTRKRGPRPSQSASSEPPSNWSEFVSQVRVRDRSHER